MINKRWLAFSGFMIVSLILFLTLLSYDKKIEPIACTEDLKLCPDGTSVSRNPALNCDFNPCPSEDRVYCNPEDRLGDYCNEVYNPVCGWFSADVNCVTYPCANTYSNSCFACKDKDVSYWTPGGCPEI